MPNILWLNEISKDSIPMVGGKGANLGEMYNNNFPVPKAFVITADAYKEFLNSTRIQEQINNILNLEQNYKEKLAHFWRKNGKLSWKTLIQKCLQKFQGKDS